MSHARATSRVACGGNTRLGCGALLAYPTGAPFVRCALCDFVTRTGEDGVATTSETRCGGCEATLVHPRGAGAVRCSVCGTVTATRASGAYGRVGPIGGGVGGGSAYVRCSGCASTLAYPVGSAAVRCAACGTVTRSAGGTSASGASSRGSSGATAAAGLTSENMVVVENPPTLTSDGRVVSNVSVGIRLGPNEFD